MKLFLGQELRSDVVTLSVWRLLRWSMAPARLERIWYDMMGRLVAVRLMPFPAWDRWGQSLLAAAITKLFPGQAIIRVSPRGPSRVYLLNGVLTWRLHCWIGAILIQRWYVTKIAAYYTCLVDGGRTNLRRCHLSLWVWRSILYQ